MPANRGVPKSVYQYGDLGHVWVFVTATFLLKDYNSYMWNNYLPVRKQENFI